MRLKRECGRSKLFDGNKELTSGEFIQLVFSKYFEVEPYEVSVIRKSNIAGSYYDIAFNGRKYAGYIKPFCISNIESVNEFNKKVSYLKDHCEKFKEQSSSDFDIEVTI